MDALLSSMESTVLSDRAAHTVCIIILRTAAGVYSCILLRYYRRPAAHVTQLDRVPECKNDHLADSVISLFTHRPTKTRSCTSPCPFFKLAATSLFYPAGFMLQISRNPLKMLKVCDRDCKPDLCVHKD